MKNLLVCIGFILFLVGCTDVREADQPDASMSLEEQIKTVMNQHDYPPHTIINYQIKHDYIYVFTDVNHALNVAVLEYASDQVEWIMGYDSISKMSILDPAYDDMPVLTVIKTDDPAITAVEVLGEPAFAFQSFEAVTDDYRIGAKYWIHFTEMKQAYADFENQNLPVHSVELFYD